MMKKISLLLFLILIMTGCSKDTKFHIYGTMSDNSCDGSKIFLVPAVGPQTHWTVDSVVIENGKFYFEGDKEQPAILRLEMQHRMNHQELLLITEPGDIKAFVGPVGKVVGTKQNDSLQVWKELHESFTSQLPEKWNKWKESNDSTYFKEYISLYDSLSRIEINYTYKMLLNEKGSTLGNFFFNNYKSRFNNEQKTELAKYYKNEEGKR